MNKNLVKRKAISIPNALQKIISTGIFPSKNIKTVCKYNRLLMTHDRSAPNSNFSIKWSAEKKTGQFVLLQLFWQQTFIAVRTFLHMFAVNKRLNGFFWHIIWTIRTLVYIFHMPLSIAYFISGIAKLTIFKTATVFIIIIVVGIIVAVRIIIHLYQSKLWDEKKNTIFFRLWKIFK